MQERRAVCKRGRTSPALWLAWGIVFLLLLGWSEAANAQTDYPGGYTLMPLNPGPVRLLSTTVDASVRDDGQQTWVDVQAGYRVHNTDKNQPRPLRVAFPGYPVSGEPPQQFGLTTSGREIALSRGNQQWWVAEVSLQPDERLTLLLNYTAGLGEAPFVSFRYPLDLTARLWPGRLESARFTLTFAEPPNPQSWLHLTPENHKLTAEALTWSFDTVDPEAPIDYLFLRPTLWQKLRAARQAASVAGASSTSHLTLGDIYVELATAANDPALFDRYFPLAVAAYHQAQIGAPADPAAYQSLADLYRRRAARTDPPDPTYLALATDQLATALENGVRDPGMVTAVTQEFAAAIAQARQAQQFDTANAYLARLQTLAAKSQTPLESEALAQQRQGLVIDWARAVLHEQGPMAARAILEENFGHLIAAKPFAGRFARMNSLQVEAETQPGLRRLRVIALPREDGEQLVQDLHDALRASGAATVTLISTQPPTFQLDIPFRDGDELKMRQGAIASSVSGEPEWALLAALLRPDALAWQRTDERWRSRDIYTETIDLGEVETQIENEAQTLEQAAAQVDAAQPLMVLLGEIWRAEAGVWRQLAANSQARYILTLYPNPGAVIVRTWALAPGGSTPMRGQAMQYHWRPLLWLAGGLYVGFVAITGIIWLWRRK